MEISNIIYWPSMALVFSVVVIIVLYSGRRVARVDDALEMFDELLKSQDRMLLKRLAWRTQSEEPDYRALADATDFMEKAIAKMTPEQIGYVRSGLYQPQLQGRWNFVKHHIKKAAGFEDA